MPKSGKHGGHRYIGSVILLQPNCDLRVVRTTAYLKAIMEAYEKPTVAGLGPFNWYQIYVHGFPKYIES